MNTIEGRQRNRVVGGGGAQEEKAGRRGGDHGIAHLVVKECPVRVLVRHKLGVEALAIV